MKRLARLAEPRVALRIALFGAIALAFTWPALRAAAALGEFRDAEVLFGYESMAVRSVRTFHQWPLWDPWFCGGLYALGTPQSRFASPTFLLSLLFGAQRAQALTAFFLVLAGLEGTYRYCRTRTQSGLAALVAAPIYACSGIFALSYFKGWIGFFGFELVPWALFGLRVAFAGKRWGVAVAAASVAVMVGFGGTYSVPLCAVAASAECFFALARARKREQLASWLGTVAVVAFASVALSAFRLWPIAETLAAAPRIMAGSPGHSWEGLRSALFDAASPHGGDLELAGSYFVGGSMLALGLLAVVRPSRSLPTIALACVWLWLARGYDVGWSAFAWLRHLPVYETLRYPERFLALFALAVAELAAIGIDGLAERLRKHGPVRVAILAGAATLGACGLFAQVQSFHRAVAGMSLGAPPNERADGEFRQSRGNRWLAAEYEPMQRGSLSCWEAYPVRQSKRLAGNLEAEEFLADASAGTVARTRWSPNRLELAADLARSSRIVVNQNWHPGWRSNVGTVVSDEGRLAIDVPAGRHDVVVRFVPRSAFGGLLVTLAAVAAIAVYVKRGARVRIAAAALPAPVVTAALVLVAWREPRAPKPVELNANGAPVLVADAPPDAKPIEARFDVPVELVAATVAARPDATGTLPVELYWKVSGDVPRSAGVFVHVEGKRHLGADHQVIGSSMFLSDAPQGALLRDAFSIYLGSDRPSGTWDVYVGLWHATGDGKRIAVTNPGTTGRAVDDRVHVANVVVP